MDIVAVFCEIDDFYRVFEPVWKKTFNRQRTSQKATEAVVAGRSDEDSGDVSRLRLQESEDLIFAGDRCEVSARVSAPIEVSAICRIVGQVRDTFIFCAGTATAQAFRSLMQLR